MTDQQTDDDTTADTRQIPVYQSTPTAPRGEYPTGAESPTREVETIKPAEPPQVSAPDDGPLSSLNDEQRARVAALHLVQGALTGKAVFGGAQPPDVFDLMRLAEWVLTGVDLVDLYRSHQAEGQ